MKQDVTELIKIKDSIKVFSDRITVDIDTRNRLIKELQQKCEHPSTYTKRQYSSGGYDYLSSVIITNTCAFCDKILECYDDPKHTGQYG